jgi:hypothetical protein
MALAGIGANRSHSSSLEESQSQSDEFSLGLDVASSFGEQGSQSTSTSRGASSSRQIIAFEDLFRSLYGDAGAAAKGIDPGIISGASKQLFSGGLEFLKTLQGNAGTDALEAGLADTSGRDAQLALLKQQLGDFFGEELLPGITDVGVSTGTFGGGREAVLRSSAAKAVAGQFSTGAAGIISGDQARRDASAAQLAQLKQGGAGAGLGALGSLLNLSSAGEFAALSPYEALASIYGGPTVLGSSESTDIAQALSDSFGVQGSQSYGFDFGRGTSSSSSRATSSSKSKGLQLGFL